MNRLIITLVNIRRIINKPIRWYRALKVKLICGGYSGRILVGGPTKVTRNTFLGSNVNFNGLIISGRGRVEIGNNFHSGPECLFLCEIHNYDNATAIPYDSTTILKNIKIEDNVWIGRRVNVLGGVTIGEGAIIQAGSTVVSDIPKYAIAGGHPARVFSERNIERYERLKAEGKFQ